MALAVAAAAAVPGVAQASPYNDAVLADGPLAYYQLDELSGTAADDAVAGADGTFQGLFTLGSAAPFPGAGTSVTLSPSSSMTAQPPTVATTGTIELWVRPVAANKKLLKSQSFVTLGNPAGSGWTVGIGTKRKLAFLSGGVTRSSRISVPVNRWSHVAVAWDAAQVRFTLNGGAVTKTFPLALAPAPTAGATLSLGQAAGALGNTDFAGGLDEAALYPGVLTPTQVRNHYTATTLPVATSAPTLDDLTPTEGQTLTLNAGSWTGMPALSYQWERCDDTGEACEDIAGATGTTYAVANEDVGATLQVEVSATNLTGTTTAYTPTTEVVTELGPLNQVAPTVTGLAQSGQTLNTQPGTWTGSPAFTYQWQRCDALASACADIVAATSAGYAATDDDVGGRLRTVVTGTNGAASTSAASSPTDVVVAAGGGGTGGGGGGAGTGGGTGAGDTAAGTGSTGASGVAGAAGAAGASGAAGITTAGVSGSSSGTSCVRILSKQRVWRLRMRRAGRVVVRLRGSSLLSSGQTLKVSVTARRRTLRHVTYRLGTKSLGRAVRRAPYTRAVTPSALAGAKTRVITVRITPRRGPARTATLKLSIGRCG